MVDGNVAPYLGGLQPVGYYVWGVLEREPNKRTHHSVFSLKASIVEAVASMNREHLVNASTKFRSRLEAVIEATGDGLSKSQ
ncbi:Uncharacterized protein FKW44_001223 [Caligus rogercresseyi]|uniref:Uncharacterized protein n=1 Tax=Caligus rogercresseyi TaxID=217165 RepID=A0A7T8KIE7_CALRO|nr:Uncharacterized protein FKW44_001223 [Caligus rogercresseyi]